MDKQKVLAKLIWDLQSFLSVLDSENLSYLAQAQKKSISELLGRLQTPDSPAEDAEYMIMSCPSSSPSNEPTITHLTDGVGASEMESSVWLRKALQGLAPPLPSSQEADDDDDDTYEEAEPYLPATAGHTEKGESDSSHYESYGEEEEEEEEEGEGEGRMKDRAHYIQWSASQPCLRPAPEARICGYLWRRKWLGQWTKQLFIIRNDVLLCYKCARDLLPQVEMQLRGCQLAYKCKSNRKIQHQLKLLPPSGDALVLGYSTYQQAHEWRTMIEEVSVGDETETHNRSQLLLPSSKSFTVLNASEEREAATLPDTRAGVLNVLLSCQWQSLLCRVEAGLLNMFAREEEAAAEAAAAGGRSTRRSPQYTLQLRGCRVGGGPDAPPHSYRITLSTLGDQLAVLEASSAEEKQRWMRLLRDGAAHDGYHDDEGTAGGGALPSKPALQDQPIYSNSALLEHMAAGSEDSQRCGSVSSRDSLTYSNTVFTSYSRAKPCEVERGVQKLELTGRKGGGPAAPLRAGSEANLSSAGKQNKRSSFRQSLAVCTERAQAGFLNPLLRRTASAKTSLRRAPSALFIEHGKVFQRKKEWETKTAA